MNRRSMDLVEGKSEFNVEYFEIEFALILSCWVWHNSIFCFIILLIFSHLIYSWIFIASLCILIVIVIYVQRVLPRIRHDELVNVLRNDPHTFHPHEWFSVKLPSGVLINCANRMPQLCDIPTQVDTDARRALVVRGHSFVVESANGHALIGWHHGTSRPCI